MSCYTCYHYIRKPPTDTFNIVVKCHLVFYFNEKDCFKDLVSLKIILLYIFSSIITHISPKCTYKSQPKDNLNLDSPY